MKVVFVKSPTGKPFNLAYNEGDTAEVPDETAKRLIKAKIAVDSKELKGENAGAKSSGEAVAPASDDSKELKGENAGAKSSGEAVAPASEKATSKGPAKSEKATKK